MSLALKKVGQDKHFEGVDFFQALVVGDEKCRSALDRCGDLQRIRQAYAVARPHQGRGLGELLVYGEHGERGERFQGEFDFIDEAVLFVGERFSQDLRQGDGRCDGVQALIAKKFKRGFEEIGVGLNVLDKIDQGRGIETDDSVLFDSSAKFKRVAIHRGVCLGRYRSWIDRPRFL